MKGNKKKKQKEPEIYAIKKDNEGTTFSRKEFLGTVGTIGVGLAIGSLGACENENKSKEPGKILDNGNVMSNFKAHSDTVNIIRFSPDGKIMVSGSKDRFIKLWSIPDGKLIKRGGHARNLNTVSFSPDGKTMASGCDKIIKLWSIPDGKLLKTFEGNSYYNINKVIFSPNGNKLVSLYGGHLKKMINIWSVSDGKLLKTLKGHSKFFNLVNFSPDGNSFASVSDDKTIELWSIWDGELIKSLEVSSRVEYLSFSPNGKILISKSRNNTIKLWSLPDGKFLKSLGNHFRNVDSIIFSPDEKIMTSRSGPLDKTIKMWSMPNGKLLKTLEGHSDNVYSIIFSPDGKTLASWARDKTIKLWSMPDGKLLNTLKGHSSFIRSVIYSPDGKTLASGSSDNSIRLWSMPEGEPCYILFDPSIMKETKVREMKQMGLDTICTCNTILIPSGTTNTDNLNCICNTIVVGTSSSGKGRRSRGGSSRTYWHPN